MSYKSYKKCKCSVKIEDLHVKNILDDINLVANHGETLALIGKNGAGKTTLLKSILHSIDFTGNINFFNSYGQKISKPKIGYVPQRLSFDKNTPITVLDMFCANLSRFPIWVNYSKKSKEKAIFMLEKVGAEELIHARIGQLSGGELQRVLLAFALDPIPNILLLDEPVSAVDRKGISKFYSIINSLREDYHMPVILVSHDLGHVVKYANSYALINHTIIETGCAQDLLKSNRVRKTFGIEPDERDETWI